MNPQTLFCPNRTCPASGQRGQGNIIGHGRARPRWRCTVCRATFSPSTATPFARRRTPRPVLVQVLTLVSYGCPIPAIEAAFCLQARTVRQWVLAAGTHSAALHDHLVPPHDLGQVQADELRVRLAGGVAWMAMALVVSTRLWLGGVVSPTRDQALTDRLLALVARCCLHQRVLLVVDGFRAYIDSARRVLATYQAHPRGGRRTCVPWPDVVLAQVVKHAPGGTWLEHRLVRGTVRAFLTALWSTPGCAVLNTAYIERLNATFRARLAPLARRTRGLARQRAPLAAGMYLVGASYNWCTLHASLTTPTGQQRTPAMAAGLTDRCWALEDVLSYRVPPARWVPPRPRGRRPGWLHALRDRWAPTHH